MSKRNYQIGDLLVKKRNIAWITSINSNSDGVRAILLGNIINDNFWGSNYIASGFVEWALDEMIDKQEIYYYPVVKDD